MRKLLAIFKKELKVYFFSPIAYVVLLVFTIISSFFVYVMTAEFMALSLRTESIYVPSIPTMNINEMLIRPLISTFGFISMIFLPMVSMKLFAEEKRTGTLQLLLTAPVTELQIVLGKYFAALIFYTSLLGITLGNISLYFFFGSPEVLPMLTGYLGLFLMGAAFLSVGMLISAATGNQIIAVVLCFGTLLLFWVISWAGPGASSEVRTVLEYVGIYSHHQDMAKGVIGLSDLVYYSTIILFGVYCTTMILKLEKYGR